MLWMFKTECTVCRVNFHLLQWQIIFLPALVVWIYQLPKEGTFFLGVQTHTKIVNLSSIKTLTPTHKAKKCSISPNNSESIRVLSSPLANTSYTQHTETLMYWVLLCARCYVKYSTWMISFTLRCNPMRYEWLLFPFSVWSNWSYGRSS